MIGAALLVGAASFVVLPANALALSPQAAHDPSALGKPRAKGKSKKRTARPRAQKAPTADRIREIQDALARAGSFRGAPTGKWDASSIAAMKEFQAGNGLQPTGRFDARSLQKLGLGSATAGVAAPRASAKVSSR